MAAAHLVAAPFDLVARAAAALPPSALDRRLVAMAPDSLYAFTRLAWPLVEPSKPFVDGKVIHVVCEFLEAITRGDIKRAVLNVPPGFMKSLLTGVFWPAWEWINTPSMGYLYGSYDPRLSLRDARRTFELVDSEWYRERWGNVLPKRRQAMGHYFTNARGERFSTSVKGAGPGRHFLRHVADDPIKPKDANGGVTITDAVLDEVIAWWDQTISNRTFDYLALARLIVMQRLHERDLAGYVLDKTDEHYEHCCIPMRYDTQVQCQWDWRSVEGELAWPERFPPEATSIAEKGLGSPAAIAAQLQQQPAPRGGLLIKQKDLRFWHPEPKFDPNGKPCLRKPLERQGQWFQSWDMTFKKVEGTDMVAGGLWQGVDEYLFLHYAINEQLSFTGSCAALIDMTRMQPRSHRKVIEEKANGNAVENNLRKTVPGIALEFYGGKLDRAHACTTHLENHVIVLPHPDLVPEDDEGNSWLKELLKQLLLFPRAKFDDLVDMFTQAILDYYHRRNKWLKAMRNVDLIERKLTV